VNQKEILNYWLLRLIFQATGNKNGFYTTQTVCVFKNRVAIAACST